MPKHLFACFGTQLLLFWMTGCGTSVDKQHSASPGISAHDIAPVAESRSDFPPRATEGDSVWVLLNHVKVGERKAFEQFIHEVLWDSAVKLQEKDQKVFHQTRVLHPVEPEKDGSYTYMFIMDPVISEGDYDIENLLKKMYGEEKAKKEMIRFENMQTHDQSGYTLIQSKH